MAITWIVFGCVFGAALAGMLLRAILPERHLSADTESVVKLGMGLIGTMAALVLGLLIASAQGSYDTRRGELTTMAAKLALLDRILAHYGPETKDSRELLRRAVARMLNQIWPENGSRPAQFEPRAAGAEPLYDKLNALTPHNDAQRSLLSQALSIAVDIAQTRWLLFVQSGSSISTPFLVVLVFWLAVIFASFGMFAPRNLTAIAVLFVCALSVAGAIFLVLELDHPFQGLIQISSVPLRTALAQLGK